MPLRSINLTRGKNVIHGTKLSYTMQISSYILNNKYSDFSQAHRICFEFILMKWPLAFNLVSKSDNAFSPVSLLWAALGDKEEVAR